MFEKIKDIKRSMILLSLFSFVLGAFLLIYPDTSSHIICYVFAGLTMAYGIFHIVMHFRLKIPFTIRLDLVQGVLAVGLAIYVFLFPDIILSILPIVFGIVVLLDGIVKLESCFDMKKIGYSTWVNYLIAAILVMLLGVLLIFYPFESILSIIMFSGIVLIVNAVNDLIHIFAISKQLKKYDKEIDTFIQKKKMRENQDFFE